MAQGEPALSRITTRGSFAYGPPSHRKAPLIARSIFEKATVGASQMASALIRAAGKWWRRRQGRSRLEGEDQVQLSHRRCRPLRQWNQIVLPSGSETRSDRWAFRWWESSPSRPSPPTLQWSPVSGQAGSYYRQRGSAMHSRPFVRHRGGRKRLALPLRCGTRKRPVCEARQAAISSGGPAATTSPPCRPPSGPRSMT